MPKIKVNGRINKVNGNNGVRLRAVYKGGRADDGVRLSQYWLNV